MAKIIIEPASSSQIQVTVTLENEAIIGRDKSNIIFIDDQHASRQHAKIIKEKDGFYHLVDLGSRNGSFVNDEKIYRRRLKDKDQIKIGKTAMVFIETFVPERAQTPTQQVGLPGGEMPAPGLSVAKTDIVKKPEVKTEAKSKPEALKADKPAGSPAYRDKPAGRAEGRSAFGVDNPAYSGKPELEVINPDDFLRNSGRTESKSRLPAASRDNTITRTSSQAGVKEAIEYAAYSDGKLTQKKESGWVKILFYIAIIVFFITILLWAKWATEKWMGKLEEKRNAPSGVPANSSGTGAQNNTADTVSK